MIEDLTKNIKISQVFLLLDNHRNKDEAVGRDQQ